MCKNMTHALKANKLLYNCGVFSKVEKDADNPDVNGCVYCIMFDDKESVKALEFGSAPVNISALVLVWFVKRLSVVIALPSIKMSFIDKRMCFVGV